MAVTVNHRLFYLLNIAQHRVYKYADKQADKEMGISITQLGALMVINENEGCLLKDLANTLDLNNSALTGLGNRLEQNGYVKREACSNDGRASRLFLTKTGKEKVAKAIPLIQQLNEQIHADFTEDELKVIAKFLTHLISHF